MEKMRLTENQQKTLDCIREAVRKRGYPPSVREIRSTVGLKSTKSAYDCLLALEEKGYISREHGKTTRHHDFGRQPHGNRSLRMKQRTGPASSGGPH